AEGSPGRVTVVTTPVKASVRLEGEKIGETPMLHQLEPGMYELKVSASGFRSVTRKISVLPGEHKLLDIELELSRRARQKLARKRSSRIKRRRSGKTSASSLPDISSLTIPKN
ncbi:MAG: PEGA domain-containing protein, partial [Myxococcota bacterium]